MDIQKIINIESEIRKIIELTEEESFQHTSITPKEHEFYGDVARQGDTFIDNDPNIHSRESSPRRELINYLETLSLKNLKIIRSLMLTGEKINEENIEDEEIENLEEVYDEIYNYLPDDRKTIIDDILNESSYAGKFLTNGLMYCLN
ncbi:MAG: hypothetical protein ACOCZT_02965 [Halanaerobiales bacterium]